jgi:NADH:ubiquinone oxidoreductase subunit 2 (subunit N)
MIFFFTILFFFQNNNNIWYFTDLQYFFKNSIIATGFSILFISMAGIPPFLGFFAKISLVSLLLYNEEYLLFFLTLISGFFISFFYIQNYRFFGYNIKNINYNKNIFIIKNNKNLYIYYYLLLFINIFSFFFINDFFIFSTFIALN